MSAPITVPWNRSLRRAGTSPVPLGRVFATGAADAASPLRGWPLACAPFCCCGFAAPVPAGAFAIALTLVHRLAAALAHALLPAVAQHLDARARGLVAAAADQQHVREGQRALALDDAALPHLLRGALVLLDAVDLLDAVASL